MRPLKKRKRTEFPPLAVFDIETTDWVNVRVICHLDEYGNRLAFRTVKDYLQWLLTEFEGKSVWSHFGSGFDNRFLIEEVHKWEGTSYKAIMSGGLPIIFILENERYTAPHPKHGQPRPKQVTLLDSFRLLPAPLADIGQSVGVPKLEVDRSRLDRLSHKQVVDYCMRDCEALMAGMVRFRKTLLEQGGHYSPTSASVSSNFIRSDESIDWRKFFEPGANYQRYSGESFEMGYPGSVPGMIQADEFCEPAYYGGRCEVFKRGTFRGPLYYYDIASAYPWAMRQKLPFYFAGFEPGASWEDRKRLERVLKWSGVSDARVYIPEGTFDVPPLPVRTKSGKVVFAEGKFHGRWTNAELWALYKRGREKGVRVDVTCCARFSPHAFARPFVDRFYTLRKQAKEDGDVAEAMILKILLNSCYGKLAQQLEQSCYIYGPAYEWLRLAAEEDGTLMPSPLPGVWEILELTAGPFRHVAAGAYVTALARIRLLEGMERALRHGAQVYYCDTDSIVLDKPMRGWGDGVELGDWELESEFVSAEFLCPKVYRAVCKDGKHVLKAKGASLKSQLDRADKGIPRQAHDNERLRRWAVYARKISPWARKYTDSLTAEEMAYYGKVQAGLTGWKSGIRAGSVATVVATLDRQAQREDEKRMHGHGARAGMSRPLYLSGQDDTHLDIRTLDPESLLEIELAGGIGDDITPGQ